MEAVDVLSWASQSAKMAFVLGAETALALGDLDRAEQLVSLVEAQPTGGVPLYLRAQAARTRPDRCSPARARRSSGSRRSRGSSGPRLRPASRAKPTSSPPALDSRESLKPSEFRAERLAGSSASPSCSPTTSEAARLQSHKRARAQSAHAGLTAGNARISGEAEA